MISRKKSHRSVLGIGLAEHRAHVALLEAAGETYAVSAAKAIPMSLNILKDDPNLVGRELRKHLDEAGIRVKRCVVSVPARWLMCAQVSIPDLPVGDVDSFIKLQAERQFPLAGDEIAFAESRYETPDGVKGAMLLAIPLSRLEKVQAVARAAQLEMNGVTTAVAALVRRIQAPDAAVLLAGPHSIEFAIKSMGGLVALRTLWEGPPEPVPSDGPIDYSWLSREIRITLKRIPATVRAAIKSIDVYKANGEATNFVDAIQKELGDDTIKLRDGSEQLPAATREAARIVDPGLLAALDLQAHGRGIEPNFLLRQPSRLENIVQTVLKRRSAALIVGAVAIVLLVGTAFGIQSRTLHGLERRHAAVTPRADEARALEDKVRKYRNWFDAGAPMLDIASGLAQAFPDEGTVSLKSVSIKEPGNVSCGGKAADSRAWLAMLESLRASSRFADVRVSQIRGDAPLEFNFSCKSVKGAP